MNSITTSSAWKENQKNQVRSECNIRLTFYRSFVGTAVILDVPITYTFYEEDAVIDKTQLTAFSYQESYEVLGINKK